MITGPFLNLAIFAIGIVVSGAVAVGIISAIVALTSRSRTRATTTKKR